MLFIEKLQQMFQFQMERVAIFLQVTNKSIWYHKFFTTGKKDEICSILLEVTDKIMVVNGLNQQKKYTSQETNQSRTAQVTMR